jgi:cytochrome c5
MKKRKHISLFSLILLAVIMTACSESVKMKPQIVKQISEVTIDLPQGEGYNAFMANCTSCHSARYVQMQPNFNHKTWEKTVDKMIYKFGAPISDSSITPIVNYLMAVRGK